MFKNKQKQKSRFFTAFLILAFAIQVPTIALGAKCKKPIINPCEKINYVNINWWNNFSDPCLKYYVTQAITNNHNAKEASWKVEQYRQFVKIQFAQELPSLSVGADYIGAHFPDTIKGIKNNIFAVPFQANYEADVFLKNHDKTKSSKKTYEASKFEEQSIYISLASDVATTYINLIKFDKQIQLQQELVNVKAENLSREESRYQRGVTSIPKLNDYKKNYETSKNNLDELTKSRDKLLNQLAVLTGETPANASSLKRNSWDNLEYTKPIPAEISSDVVFSRPDILAAESELEKSQIDVRVARKEFLPKINITGLYSFSNIGPDGFGTWGSTIAGVLAGATLDLFKGGQKVANLKAKKAVYEQMFEAYKQADLNALKEINDSLILINEDTKIHKNTAINLALQNDNYRRAYKSYKSGAISYTNLLSEKELVINQQQSKINTKSVRLVDYITLYKAVGGKL